MSADPRRREFLSGLTGVLTLAGCWPLHSARAADEPSILFANVRIFDGVSEGLVSGHLLVRGRMIEKVEQSAITPPPGCTVIDGANRVLMPGLTDAHWHLTMVANSLANLTQADTGLMYANTVAEAQRTLLRGFTTVRDVAGPSFGIKLAIDSGVIPGPRVYPSGAMISATAGHGDFSPAYDAPQILGGAMAHLEAIGIAAVANGVPQVLAAAREQLKRGASQLKIAVGGGVTSEFDPVDSVQFTLDEVRAAVQVANGWDTYVASHVFTPQGIRLALEGGVRSIEHGHLADEPAIEAIGSKGAWLSTQTFEPGDMPLTPAQIAKARPMVGAWKRILGWAKKHDVKVAFGTDLLFQSGGGHMQNVMLTRLADVYSPVDVLKIATSGNCALFAMSGRRNPYRAAKLGVLLPGAWADMVLVDGDPTKDVEVLRDYEKKFVVIVKDGTIFKNVLR
jgi:imidazolonepropionase-like amidohydrolase